MLSWLEMVFLLSGIVALGLLAFAYRWRPRITRDGGLFLGGLVGVAHETFVSKVERPSLLILFGAMMGIPAFIRRDEAKREPAE